MPNNNTQTQSQLAALRTLQESYDVLATASSNQATSTALETAKQAILSAISALTIPTVEDIQSGLAMDNSVRDGNDTAIGMLKDNTNGLSAIKNTAASALTAAQAITGYALQGSGNTTQTDIANAIGTPATGQPSTLFEAIAAGGGGGGGGGDATAANQQIIIAAVKDNNDTTIGVVKDIDTYGAKDATVAKETNATANKNQVISAIGDTLSMNMLATGLSAMAGVPINEVTEDGTTAYTLNANELYYFNNRFSDLELTLDLTTVSSGDAADFHLIVQVDNSASPLTVTIKDSNDNDVVWSWDLVPDFSAGVIYEIGIINNLALYVNYVV